MSRTLSLVTVLSLILSACLPPFLQPEVAVQAPGSESDLQATAALLAQQTLDALPSSTSAPSQTPVVKTATDTVNPSLTPGLGTGTVTQAATLPSTTPTPTGSVPAGSVIQLPTTGTVTLTLSPIPGLQTATETLHPRFSGTQAPDLPSGSITLVNKSKSEVYVSLQCTTKDGSVTILEYPVPNKVLSNAPAGKYLYVAWVGGKKITGSFSLSAGGEKVLTIYKDKVTVK